MRFARAHLKPVKIPLDVIPSLQHVNSSMSTTQLGVVGKLAEVVTGFHLDIELLTTTLSATIQPIPYPQSGPSVKSMSLQFRDKDVVRDSVKCFAQVKGSELAVHPPWCPTDLELHHFMVTAAKAALELHFPHQPLLVGENKVWHSTSPRWLLYHLEKEVIINTFQEPPGLLMACCVVPPTDIRGSQRSRTDVCALPSTLAEITLFAATHGEAAAWQPCTADSGSMAVLSPATPTSHLSPLGHLGLYAVGRLADE
ncbi:hypothetical protein QYF61_011880 [Mycteria americana]|uniref:Uncharacterized protein n=1 Tax=Mycteria americana TaxID=33587 RepID=A0AAN7N923_MYCAM|nr:hypothetical protein QYF61_011880 [Mycteria americana]